jgi:hypothetical protein
VLTVQELVADLTQAGAVDLLGQLLKSEAPAVASGAAEMLAFLFHIRSVTVEVTDGAFESAFVRYGQVLASLRCVTRWPAASLLCMQIAASKQGVH